MIIKIDGKTCDLTVLMDLGFDINDLTTLYWLSGKITDYEYLED